METDTWYQKKLIEDVPEEELHAALIDEDFEDDEGEDDEVTISDFRPTPRFAPKSSVISRTFDLDPRISPTQDPNP